MIRAADAGDEHVQIVDLLRVYRGQAARQKVRLLLVVALQSNPVARGDERLQCRDYLLGGQDTPTRHLGDPVEAAGLVLAPGAPAGAHRLDDPVKRFRPFAGHPVLSHTSLTSSSIPTTLHPHSSALVGPH